MTQVAIIGAGPSGLAAARWLKREGFEPVLFEQGDTVGGQWSGDPRYSGVWPSLHTNTCREMTQFSDMPHAAGTPLYPSNQTMLAYLTGYAERFGLLSRLRLRTRVTALARDASRG
jgi:dimethylaniline monooxygenase (N-oxide forming)